MWIEIVKIGYREIPGNGHFPCGSVDWNLYLFNGLSADTKSLPLRKCGLKSYLSLGSWPFRLSLPLRKCGLKLCSDIINVIHNRHFPCGSVDWNADPQLDPCRFCVTSLAEVWIEIRCCRQWLRCRKSLPLRKCGLKYLCYLLKLSYWTSLPLRKCGLKFGNYHLW